MTLPREIKPGDVIYCAQCERVWVWHDTAAAKRKMCRCAYRAWELIAEGAQ